MKSMTGYGAGSAEAPAARVAVEIRSVNQRFLDVRVTAAREYAAWEREIRSRVQAVAQRGRVDVTVARTPVAARRRYAVTVRMELARAYVQAGRELADRLGLGGSVLLADVLRLPDLFEVSERAPELGPELPAVRRALGAALRAFDAERRRALTARGPVGKRIEFLLQEVHRELTTTGAKAGDLAIGELVLAAKAEAEKLREQVQNVE
ncbi:MAG: DUF1732 domain-containing protein [Deltaproteobacteria bacterium]|nr:MAG: DUF1732 domain-containing protein [Deltaproteobacteria bacterium]